MIACGWCGKPTGSTDRCSACGHVDPARPWVQRGEDAPRIVSHDPGRPELDPGDVARRLASARAGIVKRGLPPTVEALAEALDVSPRTVRRWQKVAG